MNYFRKPNFLFLFLILFTLSLSVTSSPFSLTGEVLAKSDNASDGGGSNNGDNGKGHDKGDDGGSDGGDDGGSDGGDDGGSDGGDDGGSDGGDDGGSDGGDDGGSDGGDDGGSDGGDDGGSDGGDDGGSESNLQSDPKNQQSNNNNVKELVSPIVDQTIEDKYGSKVFYVLIKNANNKTTFVPDKVTLTAGSTIVWLNQDNSDHRITVGSDSKSEYALLNSLILPNGMVDQQFQSAGTFYYSDLESPQSKGIVTILDGAEKDDATSIPLEE